MAGSELDPDEKCAFTRMGKFVIISLFIGVLMTLENILCIAAIWRTPSLRNTTNILFTSLAFTDVLVGLLVVMASLSSLLDRSVDIPNDVIQTVTIMMMYDMSFLSIIHIAVIAVERYIYIAKPFFYQKNIGKSTAVKILTAIWFLNFIYIFSFIKTTLVNGQKACRTVDVPEAMSLYISLPVYVICCTIACVCYIQISLIGVKQGRCIRPRRKNTTSSTRSSDSTRSGGLSERRRDLMKSVKFFSVVFGTFVALTLPGAVSIALARFIHIPYAFYFCAIIAITLNSGTNVIIYVLINGEFRKALKDLLICSSRAN